VVTVGLVVSVLVQCAEGCGFDSNSAINLNIKLLLLLKKTLKFLTKSVNYESLSVLSHKISSIILHPSVGNKNRILAVIWLLPFDVRPHKIIQLFLFNTFCDYL
jgi:hypothetical protein